MIFFEKKRPVIKQVFFVENGEQKLNNLIQGLKAFVEICATENRKNIMLNSE